MNDGSQRTYDHTQRGPWHLVLFTLGVIFLAIAWQSQAVPALAITFLVTGAVMLLLTPTFAWLNVSDEDGGLVVRFGPVPLFRRRIRYEDILSAETGRTVFLEGWGIHLSPRGGWVWNIWGYDCVVLRLRRGTLRIGTDDPEGLAAFLKARVAGMSGESR